MASRSGNVRKKISKTAKRITKAAKKVSEPVVDAAKDAASSIKSKIEDLRLDTGEAGSRLEDRTKQQLYNRARELDVSGRSSMTKAQLIRAIRRAQ